MEVPDGWRRAHPKQPLDGPDGCRTHQHSSSGLKSTTGRCRGGSLAWIAPGGCYIKTWRRGSYSRKCSVVCTGTGQAKRYQRSQPVCPRWHLALPYTSSRLQPDGWLSRGPGPTSSWMVVEGAIPALLEALLQPLAMHRSYLVLFYTQHTTHGEVRGSGDR